MSCLPDDGCAVYPVYWFANFYCARCAWQWPMEHGRPKPGDLCACKPGMALVVAHDVQIHGNVSIGQSVSISGPTELNGTGSEIRIGDGCDIAADVVLIVADSHLRCIGKADDIERGPITLEHCCFVGSHSFVSRNVHVGHHSVIAAGTMLVARRFEKVEIPPYSLVFSNPWQCKPGYYAAG